MGPVVIRADLVVPPVSAESDAVCVYRCLFFHFIDEYLEYLLNLSNWPSYALLEILIER